MIYHKIYEWKGINCTSRYYCMILRVIYLIYTNRQRFDIFCDNNSILIIVSKIAGAVLLKLDMVTVRLFKINLPPNH